jgi:hypothetical protein
MQDPLEQRTRKQVAFLEEQREALDSAIDALLEYQRLIEQRLARQDAVLRASKSNSASIYAMAAALTGNKR